MDTYSSAESSKPCSTHRAYVLNELKEARKALAQKDEALQRLEERMAKIELKQEGVTHSLHSRHISPRHSSKSSSNAHDNGQDTRRRRHRHPANWGGHHHEQRHQQETKPQVHFMKIPSFNGDSDPNVYLDWDAKCEQNFNTFEVEEGQKVTLAVLEFVDYAMKWWHSYVTDICYNKRPPVVFWNDLVECMRFRFVPPHFRKDLMLKL
ncbi:uncharacterized protein [Phaseolus vulgaris]|uniref:uncharacterized protein n=1 Tax=Phaseolus vulgaris TaxID=3885 RepID=UPI0035CB5AB5